jgi:hypothetical protein
MKALGNIYLTWRKGKSGRRFPIGIIKKNKTQGVRFSYIDRTFTSAKEVGCTVYEGFPDVTKVYSENVIEIFGQRLMRSERNDLSDFYDFWHIDPAFKKDSYYMLAYTQGILPTDNYEFLADFNPIKGLAFITEIAGLSKYNVPAESIILGDALRYELEPNNDYDNHAVKVFKGSLFLGYVKTIHYRVF